MTFPLSVSDAAVFELEDSGRNAGEMAESKFIRSKIVVGVALILAETGLLRSGVSGSVDRNLVGVSTPFEERRPHCDALI